jgi:hypothetical protein
MSQRVIDTIYPMIFFISLTGKKGTTRYATFIKMVLEVNRSKNSLKERSGDKLIQKKSSKSNIPMPIVTSPNYLWFYIQSICLSLP